MKTIRIILIILRISLVGFTGLYVYLILNGVSGGVMTIDGFILLGILLCTRYLAKMYDFFAKNVTVKQGASGGDAPQSIDNWSFDPFDYLGSGVDSYLVDLLKFITKRSGKVFVPSKSQRFKIWWEDTGKNECHTTGQVKKMSITDDDRILFETTSGKYIGEADDCIDLIVTKMVCEQERDDSCNKSD